MRWWRFDRAAEPATTAKIRQLKALAPEIRPAKKAKVLPYPQRVARFRERIQRQA